MTTSQIISITVPLIALVVSTIALIFNGMQVRRAARSFMLNEQIARGNAVMHFTDRFFKLAEQGEPHNKLREPEWAYQFWSLQATEFYFFHHGVLPTFMYTLWMIDMASFYSGSEGEANRKSHLEYLKEYSFNYPEMNSFFNDLYELARTSGEANLRNQKVADFITAWIAKNKKEVFA